jgi:hypothetical protein
MTSPAPESGSPGDENDRGTGLMFVVLIAGAIMCVGSIGGASYFVWKAARNARDREVEAEHAAHVAAEQKTAAVEAGRYELVARALAEQLDAPKPIRDSYSPHGKPLLSWRVHLLPHLAQAELYQQFKLDEPWDGPTNRKLIEKIPKIYDHAGDRSKWMQGWTYMRGFSQPGAIFDSADPVEWTKPDVLDWNDQSELPPVGGSLPDWPKFIAATASGRVKWIDYAIQPDVLWQISARRHGPAWDQLARKWMD